MKNPRRIFETNFGKSLNICEICESSLNNLCNNSEQSLKIFGKLWKYLKIFESHICSEIHSFTAGRQFLAASGIICSVWDHLAASGSVWQHLAAPGSIWAGNIWQHLAASGIIGQRLVACGTITQHLGAPGSIWVPPPSDPTTGAHESRNQQNNKTIDKTTLSDANKKQQKNVFQRV